MSAYWFVQLLDLMKKVTKPPPLRVMIHSGFLK